MTPSVGCDLHNLAVTAGVAAPAPAAVPDVVGVGVAVGVAVGVVIHSRRVLPRPVRVVGRARAVERVRQVVQPVKPGNKRIYRANSLGALLPVEVGRGGPESALLAGPRPAVALVVRGVVQLARRVVGRAVVVGVAGAVPGERPVGVGGVHLHTTLSHRHQLDRGTDRAVGAGAGVKFEFAVFALLGDGVHLGEEDCGHQDPADRHDRDLYIYYTLAKYIREECSSTAFDGSWKLLGAK